MRCIHILTWQIDRKFPLINLFIHNALGALADLMPSAFSTNLPLGDAEKAENKCE